MFLLLFFKTNKPGKSQSVWRRCEVTDNTPSNMFYPVMLTRVANSLIFCKRLLQDIMGIRVNKWGEKAKIGQIFEDV